MRFEHRSFRTGYFLLLGVFLVLAALITGQSSPFLQYAQAQDAMIACPVNEFQVLPQEWEVAGGGWTVKKDPDDLPPDAAMVDYMMLAQQFGQMTLPDGTPAVVSDEPVVILIIDDFGTAVGKVSHGGYVLDVADRMLLAARTQFNIPRDRIILDRVDVKYDNMSVPNIGDLIQNTLTDYPENTRFVLNMSFALIPCVYEPKDPFLREILPGPLVETINWKAFMDGYVERKGGYSLIQYIMDQDVDQITALKIIFDWIGSSNSDSTLLDQMHTDLQNWVTEYPDLVSVASAGNFGDGMFDLDGDDTLELALDLDGNDVLDEQFDDDHNEIVDSFAPGSWPEVISVGSTRADYTQPTGDEFKQRSVFSNDGGIKAPGEWYAIPATGEYVSGTSFAAPVVSVLVALLESSTPTIQCDFTSWKQEESQNAYFVDAFWSGVSPVPPACTLKP